MGSAPDLSFHRKSGCNRVRITECSGLEGTSVGHPVQPLPKQGDPEQAAQDLVQAGLEYLQRRNKPQEHVPWKRDALVQASQDG